MRHELKAFNVSAIVKAESIVKFVRRFIQSDIDFDYYSMVHFKCLYFLKIKYILLIRTLNLTQISIQILQKYQF